MVTPLAAGEKGALARGGALSLAGAALSALAGFALSVLLARLLGDAGTGVVLQVTGVLAVVAALAKLGLDSAALWALPRARVADLSTVRATATTILLGAVVPGALGGVVVGVLGRTLWRDDPVGDGLVALAPFLPAAVVVTVALGVTRGLGSVGPYVVLGNVTLPLLRVVGVLAAVTWVGGSTAAAVGWAAPLPLVLVAALGVVRARLRAIDGGAGRRVLDAHGRATLARYAVPRTVSAGLEQALVWLDVIVVGALAGAAAAGVYGTASRFVAVGLLVDAAVRVVVSPRFSMLLAEQRLDELRELYRVAATWLVLFSTPLYVLLVVFAPTVLGVLGEGFDEGAAALSVLCAGVLVTFLAGNVHTLLLMSGRAGWAATNKAVVLALNVVGNLLLVPHLGILGAAVSWAVAMIVDAVAATLEVRFLVGVQVPLRGGLGALVLGVVAVGLPAVAVRSWLGDGLGALGVAVLAGGLGFLGACVLGRKHLHLSGLLDAARSRAGRAVEVGADAPG